jgi:hypothetical protein
MMDFYELGQRAALEKVGFVVPWMVNKLSGGNQQPAPARTAAPSQPQQTPQGINWGGLGKGLLSAVGNIKPSMGGIAGGRPGDFNYMPNRTLKQQLGWG